MKKYSGIEAVIVVLAMLVAVSIPVVAADETGGLRYTITVTKFENRSNWAGQWSLGDAWDTIMTDMLNQTGKLIVLGETDMRNAAMDEQDLGASGRTVQGAKTPAMGQMTPAQLLVKGAITHAQLHTGGGGGGIRVKRLRLGGKKDNAELNATIYLVDSSTGMVVASKSVVAESKSKGASVGYSTGNWGSNVSGYKSDNMGKALEDAVAQAVEWIVTQLPNMPWRGSVVLVKGDQVYVNRGEREGVSVGQLLAVGVSEVIRDPDTGEILDESLEELARLQVSKVKEKLSICNVISGSAAEITKGLTIMLP
jgi:curli biogenesis system outer membrane secretion channel CsgG